MDVLLFGSIAETAGADRLALQADTLAELRLLLAERIAGLDRMSHAIAVDRCIVNGDMVLTGVEEIAILPPFSGG